MCCMWFNIFFGSDFFKPVNFDLATYLPYLQLYAPPVLTILLLT